MMHAYNELYLSDAKENLAQCFDYMIRDCRMEADFAMSCFLQCRLSEEFAGGNPAVVSGMSGAELAMQVIWNADPEREMPEPTYFEEKSPSTGRDGLLQSTNGTAEEAFGILRNVFDFPK